MDAPTTATLPAQIERLLQGARDGDVPLQAALDLVLRETRTHGGTIHLLDGDGATLRLAAWSAGIPEPVLNAVRSVPIGKGMAGVAAQRLEPVSTCDLQADNAGGAARPGAKSTGLRGSICVPMMTRDRRLAGTLGVGSAESRTYSEREVDDLLSAGRAIADAVR